MKYKMKVAQQGKVSISAIAKSFDEQYHIPLNKSKEILFRHGLNKLINTRNYYLHMIDFVLAGIADAESKIKELKAERLLLEKTCVDKKDTRILGNAGQLVWQRGRINTLITIKKELDKIRSIDHISDTSYEE